MIKVISFDVDGTLVDAEYNDLIWLEEIPRLYAENKGIDFKTAYDFILAEYEKVGENDLRWYDMNYWLELFGINRTYAEIMQKYTDRIKIYPEVEKTLEILQSKLRMVVISLMPREFLDVKLKKLNGYFSRTFSTTSDFKSQKTTGVYMEICRLLCISENELLHIGDSWEKDYIAPKKAGIKTLYLDRTGNTESLTADGKDTIRTLEEALAVLE